MSRSQRISIFFSVQMIVIALLFGCASTPGRDKPLDTVIAVAVSLDSNLIAVSTHSQEVALFDICPLRFRSLLTSEGVKVKPKLNETFHSPPLAFSHDGQMLFAAGVGGQVTGWDVRSGAQIFSSPIETGVVDLVVLPDDSTFITAGPGVSVWTTDTGNLNTTLELPPEVKATSVNVSIDGQAILVGLSSGDIAVYGSADRKLIRTLKGHKVSVTGLAFAPDGKTFASNAGRYDLRLWRVDEIKESPENAQASNGTQKEELGTAGRVLSSLLSDLIAIVFQSLGGLPLSGLSHTTSEDPAYQSPHYCGPRVAFSPDGRYLASTADLYTGGESFRLFLTDLTNNKTRQISAFIYGCSVAFTRDSKIVITGGLGAPVLWNVETGKKLAIGEKKDY